MKEKPDFSPHNHRVNLLWEKHFADCAAGDTRDTAPVPAVITLVVREASGSKSDPNHRSYARSP